ncbi:hypothetical protein BST61_g9113 [Cercospora zeina]
MSLRTRRSWLLPLSESDFLPSNQPRIHAATKRCLRRFIWRMSYRLVPARWLRHGIGVYERRSVYIHWSPLKREVPQKVSDDNTIVAAVVPYRSRAPWAPCPQSARHERNGHIGKMFWRAPVVP